LKKSPKNDTKLLACTHYPLLLTKIKKYLPAGIKVISQGEIVAKSLYDYLKRHPEMENKCSQNASLHFFTTDSVIDFDKHSALFYGEKLNSIHVDL
jgi:glutamate racemase